MTKSNEIGKREKGEGVKFAGELLAFSASAFFPIVKLLITIVRLQNKQKSIDFNLNS